MRSEKCGGAVVEFFEMHHVRMSRRTDCVYSDPENYMFNPVNLNLISRCAKARPSHSLLFLEDDVRNNNACCFRFNPLTFFGAGN